MRSRASDGPGGNGSKCGRDMVSPAAAPIEPLPGASAQVGTYAVRSGSNSMNRQSRKYWSLVLIASMLASGCAPQQPFYCREDGDLLALSRRRDRDRVSGRRRIAARAKCEHAAAAHAQEHRQLRDLGPVAQRGRADHALQQPGDAAARRPGRFDGAGNDFAHARQPGRRDDDATIRRWWKRRPACRSARRSMAPARKRR